MNFNSLEDYSKHIWSMREFTKDELINLYWQFSHEIAKNKVFPFIIQGNIQWKSEKLNNGVSNGKITLISNYYEQVGKHIYDKPVKNYLQMYMNLYEIWGLIDIDLDSQNVIESKHQIEANIDRVICLTDLMSLIFSSSLDWYPARYLNLKIIQSTFPERKEESSEEWVCLPLSRSQEHSTSTIIEDINLEGELLPYLNIFDTMPDNIKPVIKTALNWHANGNKHISELNRFVNYWESMELLGSYFFKHLSEAKIKCIPKSKKQEEIMKILETAEIQKRNCMEIVHQCNEIKNPSIQTKMKSYLNLIYSSDEKNEIINQLFNEDLEDNPSLYQLRNRIAHGDISEHEFETVHTIKEKLYQIRKLSRNMILTTIKKSDYLSNNFK